MGMTRAQRLIKGLRSPDGRIRAACVLGLDHHADARSLPALLKALRDPLARVRRLAVHAIGCQACKVHPLRIDVTGLLVRRLRVEPSPRVRRVIAHMLGNQPPDARARRALATIVRGSRDARLRFNATWALSRHASVAVAR